MQRFLCLFLILPHLIQAQNFVPVQSPVDGFRPFQGIMNSTTIFADIDGDNDQDLFFAGRIADRDNTYIRELYTNDGSGNFSRVSGTPFAGITGTGPNALVDVDGDSDLDLVISGYRNTINLVMELYINDGKGNFSQAIETSLEGVTQGNIISADIDGDFDVDLMVLGKNRLLKKELSLYTNDGQGSFTKVQNDLINGIIPFYIAFADVDGDFDPDLLMTGHEFPSNNQIMQLHTNDGNGNFTYTDIVLSYRNISDDAFCFADIDGDSDIDIVTPMSGRPVYLNDGEGNFTGVFQPDITKVDYPAIASADVDGDSDLDFIVTGSTFSNEQIAKLYINDGDGNFTEVEGTPFEGVRSGSIGFADVDGDTDFDVLITGDPFIVGPNNSVIFSAKLYTNTLTHPTTSVEPPSTSESLVRLFPNPIAHGQVLLSYHSEKQSELYLSLSDISGTTLLQQQLHVTEGSNTIPLDCSTLPKGTYIVELKQRDQSTITKLQVH